MPARRLPPVVQSGVRKAWFRLLRATALIGRRLRSVEAVSDWLVRRSAFAADAPQDAVARVRDSFVSTRPLALAGTTLASVSHDGTEFAEKLDVPTLVLHGSRDPEVPPDDLQELLGALPDAEVVQLPGAGHMLPMLHPYFVGEHIAQWVRRTAD